jgi:hypothetical protein
MFRSIRLTLVVALTWLFLNSHAVAGSTTATGLASIIGAFNCVTHESSGVVWHFHSVNHLWGAWVRADTTFAPQNGQPANSASTFVGFDRDAKRWNIVSLDIAGSYYTRYSGSAAFNGSRWADGYPADGANAVIRLRGTRQYTFDLVSPGRGGRAETSSTVCTRAL